MARDCSDRPSFYGGDAWGPLPNRGFPGSKPGESAGGGPPAVEAHCVEPVSVGGSSLSVGDVSLCRSLLLGASSSSVGEGVPDCWGSLSSVSNITSCSSNVSSAASVCDSNMVDNNALLIDKVSNGNSSNVSNVDNAISNVSGDILLAM